MAGEAADAGLRADQRGSIFPSLDGAEPGNQRIGSDITGIPLEPMTPDAQDMPRAVGTGETLSSVPAAMEGAPAPAPDTQVSGGDISPGWPEAQDRAGAHCTAHAPVPAGTGVAQRRRRPAAADSESHPTTARNHGVEERSDRSSAGAGQRGRGCPGARKLAHGRATDHPRLRSFSRS